jgi:hypothetical protein
MNEEELAVLHSDDEDSDETPHARKNDSNNADDGAGGDEVLEIDGDAVLDNNNVTLVSFAAMLDDAKDGNELLKLIKLLPNSGKTNGHSIVMNKIIKMFCTQRMCDVNKLMVMKTRKGVETRTPATYGSLSVDLKQYVHEHIAQTCPSFGIGQQIKRVLYGCRSGFDESVLVTQKAGVNANRICCVAHMLLDPNVKAILIAIATPFARNGQPALLDHQKPTGTTRHMAAYQEIFLNYEERQLDYVNKYKLGLEFAELALFDPQLAIFKDATEIKATVTKVMTEVGRIKSNYEESGTHQDGPEKYEEIRNKFLAPKGKNADISYFYA